MAICPECLSEKPFWANRCHACNQYIGFVFQLFAQYIYIGTIVIIGWFMVTSFYDSIMQQTLVLHFRIIGYFIVFCVIPFALVYIFAFIRKIMGWWMLIPAFFLLLLLTV